MRPIDEQLVIEARTLKNRLVGMVHSSIFYTPRRERLKRVATKARERFTRRINSYYEPLMREMTAGQTQTLKRFNCPNGRKVE